MATGKVIGQIQVTEGNIKIVGVDGTVREPSYEGYVYENEQVVSSDADALFQIKFLALPEASAYDGIFRVLADGSVVYGRDAMESVASDESLVKVLETASGDAEDLETAAGEEGAEGSSSFTETDIVASSSVLGFFRGTNGELGFGITDFGSVPNYDAGQIPQPAITSPNVVIYDENDTIPVIQITATAEGSVTYSIAGLDSEHFNIDSATGIVTFKDSPDFEKPIDTDTDNEYNMYVTVTDTYGNYTTQLLSVNVNNVNEPVTAVDDGAKTEEDNAITFSAADILGNDKDVDGDELTITGVSNPVNGTVKLNEDGTVTFMPTTNYYGSASFNYTITDGEFSDTGTVNIDVTPVNDLPTGENNTVIIDEDTTHTFAASEFGFSDTADSGDTLKSVKITSLETVGALKLNGVDVTLNQEISVSDINSGLLKFTPVTNENGTGYDSFQFAVIDSKDGEDDSPQTMTIDVIPAADAPIVTVIPNLTPEIVQDYEDETFTSYVPVINSGRSTGILEFDGYARSVSMSIKSFDGRPNNDTGIVELIKDGEVIKTYSLNDYFTGNPSESADKTLTFSSDIYFNEVRVSNTSTNDQFKVENVALVSPYLVTYSVEASAVLTDASETLSNLILKVPSSLGGVLVVDGFAPSAILSADSAYNYYSISPENGGVELIFDFSLKPTELQLDAIKSAIQTISGNATSWESGDSFALPASSGNDVIVGTLEDDEIAGDDGNDVLFGGAGADTLSGENGNDTLAGEEGDDYIDGGSGADAVYGGAGNDAIEYDALDTVIDGGDGYDTLIGNAETINLVNVSNIEVIQLSAGTTVEGSGAGLGINASDVINATENGTLIIQSADGNLSNEVNIDDTSLTRGADVPVNGVNYAQYTGVFEGDTATLLIELNDNIVVD